MKGKILIYISVVLLMASCVDLTNEDYENEKQDIDNYLKSHSYTDENKINDGIYIKIFSDPNTDTTTPGVGDFLVTSFNVYDLDNNLISTTDSDLAASIDLYTEYNMYGPVKYALGDFVYGVAYGFSYASEGDSIEMVLSSANIGTNYYPWVVRAKIHEIIPVENISYWENAMVNEYIEGKNYSKYNDDIFYKKNIVTENDSLINSGTAELNITARFAEFKGRYSPDSLGRKCYPIADDDTVLDYQIGDGQSTFPFSLALDLIAENIGIKAGEQIEIVTTSTYAYMQYGITYSNNYIVFRYTPMYFLIDVVSVDNE